MPMGMRSFALALASGTALSAGIVPAVAWADPPSCTGGTRSFTISGGSMTAAGEGFCNAAYGRTLRVEIKHDINFRPDALVAADQDQGNKKNYSKSVNSCDNGNYATYYGRTFFTEYTTYHDSAHHKWHVC